MTEAGDGIRIDQNDDGGANTKVSLLVDGAVVSWCWIVPMTIRLGRATVRMDGIGGVETVETQRGRGYSTRVLTAAVERIKSGDAPLSTLYGIADFYPRWGYLTVGAERRTRLTDVHETQMPDGCRSRPARPADLPAVRSLYDRATRHAVGAAVRAEQGGTWHRLAAAGHEECLVAVDAADTVVGYAWRCSDAWWIERREREHPDALHIGEAFASSAASADALLAATRRWATERDKGAVEFHQPLLGPLATAAALQDSVVFSTTARSANFMGRSTGAVDLLQSLLPELTTRWSRAAPAWTGAIELDTGEDAVVIRLGSSVEISGSGSGSATVPRVQLTPGALARLALGFLPPAELLARAGVSGPTAAALAILFPEGTPHIYAADRF